MRLELGGRQPYRAMGPRDREGLSDADVTATVYAFRGSYASFCCDRVSTSTPAGRNCTREDIPNVAGVFYRNNFGERSYSMDFRAPDPNHRIRNQPPPRSYRDSCSGIAPSSV